MRANSSSMVSPATRPPLALVPEQASRSFGKEADKLQARRTALLVQQLRDLVMAPPANTERCRVAFLEANRRVVAIEALGDGQADCLSFSLRSLFRRALMVDARSMIIAHNHPSGDCLPSQRDLDTTERIARIAAELDIELLDHLIFATSGLYSMRRGGKL